MWLVHASENIPIGFVTKRKNEKYGARGIKTRVGVATRAPGSSLFVSNERACII